MPLRINWEEIFNFDVLVQTGLQLIVNKAQDIEIQRNALVSTSMSRSGRLLTAARNWAKPWRFVVTPPPVFKYDAATRKMIESVMTFDRYTDQKISLGATSGGRWMVDMVGEALLQSGSGLQVDSSTATSGNVLTCKLNTTNASKTAGTLLLGAGDYIQPMGHRYPYVVAENVLVPIGTIDANTTVEVRLNRGILPPAPDDSALAGAYIKGGYNCQWTVKVSKLPTMRFLPGQLVELTGQLELIESIL
jgi:hypothetical protein